MFLFGNPPPPPCAKEQKWRHDGTRTGGWGYTNHLPPSAGNAHEDRPSKHTEAQECRMRRQKACFGLHALVFSIIPAQLIHALDVLKAEIQVLKLTEFCKLAKNYTLSFSINL